MIEQNQRFVDFSERDYFSTIYNYFSDYVEEYKATIKQSKYKYFKWKGLTLMKDPMSLSIYQQMLQDVRPKAILEFGTFEGGSALWMKDILDSVECECVIHTFDINQEQIKLPNVDGIYTHQLDNYKVAEFVANNVELFKSLPHPILVIEDSHVNAGELLAIIDQYIHTGDYLVVEDTLSESKYEMLENFLKDFNYLVDTHYCDFWGYNNSWNFNSFLKKT